jgi:Holliday junction resolvase RusA-like endonuclease
MKYKLIVPEWNSGLNELLNHQEKRWDPRLKKMRVYNTEKVKNEKLIRQCLAKQGMAKVKIEKPIAIHYMIYAKDKKHDRMNLGSCLDKCFCDAMQTMKILSNDGWNNIVDIRFDYSVDSRNPRAEILITELDG